MRQHAYSRTEPGTGRDSNRVLSALRSRIRAGELRPGDFLPSVRQLSREHGVAVIVHRPDELAFEKVCVLERELRAAGYTTRLVFGGAGAAEEAALLAEALAQRAAAVAIFTAAADRAGAAHLEALHRSGRPYVLIDRRPAPGLDTVLIDRPAGVAAAVGRLLDGGHRRVCCLGPAQRERLAGFRRAFAERQLRLPRGWRLTEGWQPTAESGERAGAELLRLRPETTAVFAYSDIFAYGVLRGLAGRGVEVPARVSVIGFDDRLPSRFVSPPLSTIAHPHEEVGRLAAEVLLGKLAGRIRAGEGTRVAVPRYVERASTRDLAGREN